MKLFFGHGSFFGKLLSWAQNVKANFWLFSRNVFLPIILLYAHRFLLSSLHRKTVLVASVEKLDCMIGGWSLKSYSFPDGPRAAVWDTQGHPTWSTEDMALALVVFPSSAFKRTRGLELHGQ